MHPMIRAARLRLIGNLCFFAAVLASIVFFALAVSEVTTALWYILGGVLLIVAAVSVALLRLAAGKQEEIGRAMVAEAEAKAPPTPPADGLSAAFCDEMRAYSVPQLRLILDEQRDEYSPEEYAFIQKLLAEKQAE